MSMCLTLTLCLTLCLTLSLTLWLAGLSGVLHEGADPAQLWSDPVLENMWPMWPSEEQVTLFLKVSHTHSLILSFPGTLALPLPC